MTPWLEIAGVTFPTLIDRHNEIGKLYGVKFVPVGILVDAEGMLVRPVEKIDINDADLREELTAWLASGSRPAEWEEVSECGSSRIQLSARERRADEHLQKAVACLDKGEKDAALAELKKGTALDPDNWLIRKQGWAVEKPGAFYDGDVDYQWQKSRLENDKGDN